MFFVVFQSSPRRRSGQAVVESNGIGNFPSRHRMVAAVSARAAISALRGSTGWPPPSSDVRRQLSVNALNLLWRRSCVSRLRTRESPRGRSPPASCGRFVCGCLTCTGGLDRVHRLVIEEAGATGSALVVGEPSYLDPSGQATSLCDPNHFRLAALRARQRFRRPCFFSMR